MHPQLLLGWVLGCGAGDKARSGEVGEDGESGAPESGDPDSGGGETGAGETGDSGAPESGVPDSGGGETGAGETGDSGEDGCEEGGFSGAPLDLWDLDTLQDASTLDLEVLDRTTTWEGITEVEVWKVRYTSYQSEGCVISPIRITAYLARPTGESGDIPGLIVAHGLGGEATEGSASTPAAQFGVVALAFSGPGQGESEGTGSEPDHLFDTVDDPRDSWFWEHAVAAIRGLTLLESLDGVDADLLAMTGYSAGSLITYLVNGVDDRLDAAVPISASGYLDMAARATPQPGWEVDLLEAMSPPRTVDDPEWSGFVNFLDPANYLATAHGATYIINGAQDEFFPITSTAATFADLQTTGGDHRILHIQDYDHGWFALFSSEEATELAEQGLQYWLGGRLGLDPDLDEVAPMPEVFSVEPWTCYDADLWLVWSCSLVAARLDGSTSYDVDEVVFRFSPDGLAYASWNLQYDEDLDLWWAEVGSLDGTLYDETNLVWFVTFAFQDGPLGQAFTLSSVANIPDGFSPLILPIAGELP